MRYKRLEQGRFRWPATAREAGVALALGELRWLLDGLAIERISPQAHPRLAYEAVS